MFFVCYSPKKERRAQSRTNDKVRERGEGKKAESSFPPPSFSCLTSSLACFPDSKKCAGRKIKVSKSEMLWLGSMRHRKARVLDLQIRDEPLSTL